jgi:hypothetical protein
MNTIDKMAEEFKSMAELQLYVNSQQQLINKLNAKINELEEKKTHLEKLLTDNSIIIADGSSVIDAFLKCDDPEAIARTQLKILRDRSLQGELNMEETKRVEIYTKIVDGVESKRKDKMKNVVQSVSDEELLKLVSTDGQSS